MSNEPFLPPSPGKRTFIALGVIVIALVTCMLFAIAASSLSNSQVALQPAAVTATLAPTATATATPSPLPSETPVPPTDVPTPTAFIIVPATFPPTATPTHTRVPSPTRPPTSTRTRTPTRTATPSPTRDTLPPGITNVSASPTKVFYPYSNCGDTDVSVTSDVRDNVTSSPSVVLNYTYWKSNSTFPNSTQLTMPMKYDFYFFRDRLVGYYTATVKVVSEAAKYLGNSDGRLEYWVTASDDAQNVATSAKQSVIVEYCPPLIR